MSNLRLIDVGKAYGEVEVLRRINLDIDSGELAVFVGPSGCGKSTLLRLIAGLERVSSGRLEIDGDVMNDVPPSERGVAMVFQSYALYPHMSVRDNMAFALEIAKNPKAKIKEAVENAARILQLTPYLDRLPKTLSGGQRQRVAIGRAIVRNPRVFLFDEPLSNLDAALRVATRIEIADLKEQMPATTMVYVTHDQVEAMTLASRIVVLNEGLVEQVGPPLELYEHPANEFVARFIGSPAMNLLPGKIVTTGGSTEVSLTGGGTARSSIATKDRDLGRSVSVGVRPEDFIVADGAQCLYTGNVNFTEALGEVTLLHFGVTDHSPSPIVAKFPGTLVIGRGESVRLAAAADKVHLFADSLSLRDQAL